MLCDVYGYHTNFCYKFPLMNGVRIMMNNITVIIL